ncbi:MAG: hypothetical protein N2595_10475 [bacterium]|nr:hypothetical protein [bacterium]
MTRRSLYLAVAVMSLLGGWQSVSVMASRASVDFQLRSQIRYAAAEAGVNLSNIWNFADTARRLATFGGTLESTQALYRLFESVRAFSNRIDTIEQDIRTGEGNPFPRVFPLGYKPGTTNVGVRSR